MRLFFCFAICTILIACTNNKSEIDELFQTYNTDVEYATDVEVIYSDSAKVRMIVAGPTLERVTTKNRSKDIFPDGVHVKFLNSNQETMSWLDGKYLERTEYDSKVYVRDSVVLYNKENDKLETSELIWDEKNENIYTDKFVRITQPEKGDTSYGYGFETNKDFTEFVIKRKFSAKMNGKDISEALGQK